MDRARLDRIAQALVARQAATLGGDGTGLLLPSREAVAELCRSLLALLFPGFFASNQNAHRFCGHVDTYTRQLVLEIAEQLNSLLTPALRLRPQSGGDATELAIAFLDSLPGCAELIASDVEAAYANDPAAASREEIVASYPGLEAIAVQRLAHVLYRLQVPLLPRMMTEVAHSRTGIDIHPGAVIGESFAIDHGTGIVIGETSVIGKHCMLYHGVTLGAFNPLATNDSGELVRGGANKRHPDLEDHVRVYPGATILGGSTRVGHHSVIGGNVWLTRSVAPFSKVTMKDPELQVRTSGGAASDFSI